MPTIKQNTYFNITIESDSDVIKIKQNNTHYAVILLEKSNLIEFIETLSGINENKQIKRITDDDSY